MSQSTQHSPILNGPQILTVIIAAVAAVVIVKSPSQAASNEKPTPAPQAKQPAEPFTQMGYLDQRVGRQEDEKDVRCWSSFNKLQMFITNCEISEDAKTERIQQHMALIQKIYDASVAHAEGKKLIPLESVRSVLAKEFPSTKADSGSPNYSFGALTINLTEALRDYSDTIEPWRLMQTWSTRQLDNTGQWLLDAEFDKAALNELFLFLRGYDLALLRKARTNAIDRKQNLIDAEAIRAAFTAGDQPTL